MLLLLLLVSVLAMKGQGMGKARIWVVILSTATPSLLQSRFESGEGKEAEEGVAVEGVEGEEEGEECWVIDQLIDPSLQVIVFH